MSIVASFAPVAAAALLTPSGGDYGVYHCDEAASWDGQFQARAVSRFEAVFVDQRTNEYRLDWSRAPREAPRVKVEWLQLPLGLETLPAPDKLDFGFDLPRRLQGGTILLIPTEGELLQIPAKKPALTYSKYSKQVWVSIADPAHRARLIESGGWRFAAIDSKGRVAAQGPINLPDRSGMEIRYRPLADGLRAKAAAYEKACTFEPQTETR